MTAGLKAKLRRKNRLMRKGRTDEANALAKRINKTIEHRNKTQLHTVHETLTKWKPKTCGRAAVRQLIGRTRDIQAAKGFNAETLNSHNALISTDPDYTVPHRKLSVKPANDEYFNEWQVFRMLDRLRPTATGLDALPAWFLKLGAPTFYKPITCLYNHSIASSTVPRQ